MLLPATALFALATTALAQSCNTVRDPAHPPNGKQFVCGRQGALARPQLSRSFVSPTGDASGCADLCFSDPNCLSFSFRNDNSQCQTYTQNVRAQGFSRKSNTGDFFFFTRCFTKTGDCGIANGGFEDGPTSDDDDVGESTTYRPWSFKSGGDPEGLNSAMLVDNSMDSDSGDGERFMEISQHGTSTVVLSQAITTLGSDMVRNYTLLFDFNIRAITETAIYLVQLSYDGQRIGSFELYGQDTDNVNRWTPSDVYASMSFVPPPTSQMTTKMPPQLRIGIQQMGDDEEASLSLGLDAIRVVANR